MPWTAAQLAANDFGLLCAHKFPDVPVEQLCTISDWYTWLFQLDDYLVEADSTGVKSWLAGLPRFVSVDMDQAPTPTDPTTRALADLWSRTAPAMSHGWRCRFRAAVDELVAGHLQELRSRGVSNPFEYLEMKRKTAGGHLAACLAEFGHGTELPAAVASGPTIRSLVDAANDSALLLNDIFSYEREASAPGETTNMVAVLRKFLGCDAQRAVEATNDMLTERIRQFEHIADVEIPEMCRELDPADCQIVSGFVENMRDWLPGWLEWHKRAARYAGNGTAPLSIGRPPTGPTGFGTATARRLLADRHPIGQVSNYARA